MTTEVLITKAAKIVIDNLLNNIITPKIKQFTEKCKLKYNEHLIPRREHFEEYLYRTYKKYSIINTLVFKNSQRQLKDLYIPLSLIKDGNSTNLKEKFKIDKFPKDLVNTYNKILITDTAGMGKSTLTKYMLLDIIDNGHGIPIYIEMRRLKNGKPILYEIQEQINSLSNNFDSKMLLEFIQTGGFVFFLDGFDEISNEDRSKVTTNVQDFISKASNNVFVMTSRPEQSLSSFGDFQMFSINPLFPKEAYELLRKYDNQGNTSKELIKELNSGQYEMINEFLKNPLLVSLLFAAFDYKQTIPLKKHIFYRQVYDAYFDSHDLSKGDCYIHEKTSALDIDDFERILRFIGYKCLKFQSIEFEKDTLLQIIKEAKDYCSDLNFNISNYFNDLLTAVPLFCQDGQYYKWVHKSLQEYFAAQFIYKDSKESQDIILNALYNSPNIESYINLLDIYYDIDNLGFKKNIVLPFLKSYINFYEDNIFQSNIIKQEDIENRIGCLFMRDVCIVNYEIEDIQIAYTKIFERTKDILKNKTISVINFFNDISSSNYFYPQRKLLWLLIRRMSNLFIPYSQECIALKYKLEPNEIVLADIHTGEDNRDKYLFFNYYLRGGNELMYYLNYSICKKEIEKIEQNIKKKEDTLKIIDGL